jgi:glycine hydroxymethyltransferase
LRPDFKVYQRQVLDNARTLADVLQAAGLPLVSGGTDNHLMLADLTSWQMTGKEAEAALGKAGITVNKNTVPFDRQGPFVTSGIRIGTPYVTSRGMGTEEIKRIGAMIITVLKNSDDAAVMKRTRHQVADLCTAFPLYA